MPSLTAMEIVDELVQSSSDTVTVSASDGVADATGVADSDGFELFETSDAEEQPTRRPDKSNAAKAPRNGFDTIVGTVTTRVRDAR